MTSLSSFLEERKVSGKNTPCTHTTMFPHNKFDISEEEDVETFFSLYCENGFSSEGVYVGITEMPEENGPLREDFDIKLPLECGIKNHHYTEKDIETLVQAYQNILSNIIDPSTYEDKMLHCVVLEKRKPRVEQGVIKDGFHFHFPHFWCSAYVKDVYIRNKIKEYITTSEEMAEFRKNVVSKIISSKKLTLDQQIDQMVDPCAKKAWLMYGSRKDPKIEAWKVTKCFNESLETINLNVFFADELAELSKFADDPKKKLARYNLPRLLSIRQNREATLLASSISAMLNENMQQRKARKFNVKKVRSEEESLADLKVIEDGCLMDMLSDQRADDRNAWMEVGWTLFNIGQGNEKALDMWIEFSKRSEKFQDGVCEKEWEKMKMGGRTIASLMFMAKSDDPDRYVQWRKDQVETHVRTVLMRSKATHFTIANIIYHMYKTRFVCAASKLGLWYEFYNHRWHLVDNGVNIMKLIPTEIVDKFWELRNAIKAKKEDGQGTERDKDDMKKILKIIEQLEDGPFCSRVIKMCEMLFHDVNFLKKMDENRDLVCFENGVYDLKKGLFRDGSPDDYITLSTGRTYVEYSFHDVEVVELMDYLKKVYVDTELLDYFLDFICSCFQGGNRNKTFAVFTGDRDAGKTSICKLLELVFGDYCVNFPRETFIMGRGASAGGPRPDLARVRGKRIAFVKELSKNEKLHIGMVKEMTGNDSFFARTIYEKGADINPMFTLILFCNDPPQIPGHDIPMLERIRVLPHESTFPKPEDANKIVPEDIEEQFEKKIFAQDPNISETLPDYAAPLTWVLLDRFKGYLKNKNHIHVPEKVKASTENYRTKNDIYLSFKNTKIVKGKKTEFLRALELYRIFTNWYTIEHPSYAKNEKIGPEVFKNELSKRLCPIDGKSRWYGYTLKIEKVDEESQGDEVESGDEPEDEGSEGDSPRLLGKKTKAKAKTSDEETFDLDDD